MLFFFGGWYFVISLCWEQSITAIPGDRVIALKSGTMLEDVDLKGKQGVCDGCRTLWCYERILMQGTVSLIQDRFVSLIYHVRLYK